MNSQPNRTEHATEPTDRPTETERRGIICSVSATADQGRRSTDGEHQRRAAVILGGMYQFVALLNPQADSGQAQSPGQSGRDAAGHREEVELKNYCVPCVSPAKNGVSSKFFILLASPTGFEPVLPP
jgi:hypothetical protein